MRLQYIVTVSDHPEGVVLATDQEYSDGVLHQRALTISRELVAIKDDAVQAALLRDPRFVARLIKAGWVPPRG